MFLKRIGCFYIKSKRISGHQDPPVELVNACRSVAWSLGLKVFAVRNGSECLGDKNLPYVLHRLNASRGCLGGRGGQNVSDVYRLTCKKISLTFSLSAAIHHFLVQLIVYWYIALLTFILSIFVLNLPFSCVFFLFAKVLILTAPLSSSCCLSVYLWVFLDWFIIKQLFKSPHSNFKNAKHYSSSFEWPRQLNF